MWQIQDPISAQLCLSVLDFSGMQAQIVMYRISDVQNASRKNAMSILVYEQVRIVVSKLGGGGASQLKESFITI